MRKAEMPMNPARRTWIAFAHSWRRTQAPGRNNAPCRRHRPSGKFAPGRAQGAAAKVQEIACASVNSVSSALQTNHSTVGSRASTPGALTQSLPEHAIWTVLVPGVLTSGLVRMLELDKVEILIY